MANVASQCLEQVHARITMSFLSASTKGQKYFFLAGLEKEWTKINHSHNCFPSLRFVLPWTKSQITTEIVCPLACTDIQ